MRAVPSRNPEARQLIVDCIRVAESAGDHALERRGCDIIAQYEGVFDPEASIFPFFFSDQPQ